MAIIRKRAGELAETRQFSVLIGKHEIHSRERPWKADIWIVPADSAVVCRVIEIRNLVHHDHIVLQRDEAVSEANGHVQLATGFGRQLDRSMSSESGRATPHVDRNIKDSAPKHAHQLGLRGRRKLKVQPAQRSRPFGTRLVILNEAAIDPHLPQTAFLKGLAEPAALVAVPLWNDDARQKHRVALLPRVEHGENPYVMPLGSAP